MRAILKSTIITMLYIIITNNVFSQIKSKKPFPPPPVNLAQVNLNCIYKVKYNINQRRAFYPFNQTKNIQLISFKEYERRDSLNVLIKESMKANIISRNQGIPIILESVFIEKDAVDSLTDILYNYRFRGVKYEEETLCSYHPRNAIIFYDANNFAFERIDICFECNQYKKTSQKVRLGDFCMGKFDLLEFFFQKHGIKYGIWGNRTH